jgi:hypothetical protein
MKFVLCLTLAGLGLAAASLRAETVNVTVDPQTTVGSRFLGLGVQWDRFDAYPLSPADWKLTTNRLDYCAPGYLRVMWGAFSYCNGFDAAGQPRYAWQETDPARRKDVAELAAILDFAQARNTPVILGEWSPPLGLITDQLDPRWPRLVADSVAYLRNERGYTCIRYYNLINEPNGDWSHNKDYSTWLQSIRQLKREFDARGLGDAVHIIGPDTFGSSRWPEAFQWLDKSARDASNCLSAWDLHWYAFDAEVLDGTIETLLRQKRQSLGEANPRALSQALLVAESGLLDGKTNGDQQPRVRTFEYGVMMADYDTQVARAGWMGALAWDLDDAMHVVDWNHRPPVPDATTLKVWGFWNSQGKQMGRPEETAPRPWFYTWSLLSRCFPGGTRIVGTSNSPAVRFRATAGLSGPPGAEQWSVVLVNDLETNRVIHLQSAAGPTDAQVTCYHYFEGDRPLGADGFPKPAAVWPHVNFQSGLTLPMPARGVLILTTRPPR